MYFLRAVIFSIATLTFTASASPVSCSEGCPSECLYYSDCGKDCYCVGGVPSRVSSLLLLAPSELTYNYFAGNLWILRKRIKF